MKMMMKSIAENSNHNVTQKARQEKLNTKDLTMLGL